MIGILGAGKYAEVCLEDPQIEFLDMGDRDLPIEKGTIANVEVVWIRRFGWHDNRPSHVVRHDQHMLALRDLGVRRAFTLNGFGGIDLRMSVGDLAVPDDYIKHVHREPTTIFVEEGWPRVDVGEAVSGPYCPEIRVVLADAAENNTNRKVWRHAVNICVQGPHLESSAEIKAFRLWGAQIISTTIYPELIYARELGICFASLCWISDLAGRESTSGWKMMPPKEVAAIIAEAVSHIPEVANCVCQTHWQDEVNKRRKPSYRYGSGGEE